MKWFVGTRKRSRGHETSRRSFPLLVKFLDAQDVLSVQVHPDAETCRRMGKGDPKTECWYVIQAEPGAVIYKGFKRGVTRERFAKAIQDGTVADLLAAVPVRPGECHFIPAGTVHSLGAGLLIAEVQTPSDTTYRVFDWNRVDDAGKPRPLHIAEALESIHFDVTPDKLPVTTVGRLVDCEYFQVDKGHQASRAASYCSVAGLPESPDLPHRLRRHCLPGHRADGVQSRGLPRDPRRVRRSRPVRS